MSQDSPSNILAKFSSSMKKSLKVKGEMTWPKERRRRAPTEDEELVVDVGHGRRVPGEVHVRERGPGVRLRIVVLH